MAKTVKKKRTKKISKLFKRMKGTSNLEVKFAELLDELGIAYTQHFVFKKREFDFLLNDYNILVETHGCFFHCCKTHNPEAKYAFQRRNLKNDQHKVRLVKLESDYVLLTIWEHEMNDTDLLVERVHKFIDKHTQ